MQILLIAATSIEISGFKNNIEHIDILITGVGVPNTLFYLQQKLNTKKYDFVIQIGIAGAFDNNLKLGETVLITKDCFADIGIEEKELFTPCTLNGFINPNIFPYTNGWLENPLKINDFKFANAVTINKVSDSVLQKWQLQKTYNAQVETMEGAAFHFVCLQFKVPFMQIRSISNYVGERDKSRWKIKEAINNLYATLNRFIAILTSQNI